MHRRGAVGAAGFHRARADPGSASKISPGPALVPTGAGLVPDLRRRGGDLGQLGDGRRTEPVDRHRGDVLGRVQRERFGVGRALASAPNRAANPAASSRAEASGSGGPGQHVVEGPERLVGRKGLADARRQRAHRRVGHERDGARERLVEHQGQGVDVGLAVHRLALGRLGRHVAGRAHHGAGRLGVGRLGQGAGHAEVGHPDQALLVEEQVGRLDVAVDQAPGVRVGQALRHLGPQVGRLGVGEPDAPVEQVAERAPAEILQDQIRARRCPRPSRRRAARGDG